MSSTLSNRPSRRFQNMPRVGWRSSRSGSPLKASKLIISICGFSFVLLIVMVSNINKKKLNKLHSFKTGTDLKQEIEQKKAFHDSGVGFERDDKSDDTSEENNVVEKDRTKSKYDEKLPKAVHSAENSQSESHENNSAPTITFDEDDVEEEVKSKKPIPVEEAESPSPQPASDRDLSNDASGMKRYKNTRFPSFQQCGTWSENSLPPDHDGCVLTDTVPSERNENKISMYNIIHDNCDGFLVAARKVAERFNAVLYTMDALPPHIIDFDDPPMPILGTSTENARIIRGGAIAELATHAAIWREHFLSGVNHTAKNAIILSDGHVPVQFSQKVPFFHVAVLSTKEYSPGNHRVWRVFNIDDASAYYVTKEGASRLLSSATAFVRPLPQLIGALSKQKDDFGNPYLQVLEIHGAAQKVACQSKLRQGGRYTMSDQLPYHPPHHPLYEIKKQTAKETLLHFGSSSHKLSS